MRVVNGMTLFFSKEDALSNWHPSNFVVKGVEFNCVEQFMMYCKAKLFSDQVVADLVLKAQHPKDQKALGRRVANYDDRVWSQRRGGIVRHGAYAKFMQSPDAQRVLLGSRGSMLVEASPYDKIWGAGLSQDDPRILLPPETWPGLNLLGRSLEVVRERISLELHEQLGVEAARKKEVFAAKVDGLRAFGVPPEEAHSLLIRFRGNALMAAGYAQTASFSVNISGDREAYNLSGAEAFCTNYQVTDDYQIVRRELSTNDHQDYAAGGKSVKGPRL
ncbi:hypothetical protein AX279_16810 [Pseudomonas sp. J237]|nr:hypothetical protein AX279_16810 [Pseudomonas sp. J237]